MSGAYHASVNVICFESCVLYRSGVILCCVRGGFPWRFMGNLRSRRKRGRGRGAEEKWGSAPSPPFFSRVLAPLPLPCFRLLRRLFYGGGGGGGGGLRSGL